jgi:hypothetical protein
MKYKDKFFAYGRVGIDEWDWSSCGATIAKHQRKTPEVYINFDVGKLLGMFSAIEELKARVLKSEIMFSHLPSAEKYKLLNKLRL